MKYLIFLFSWLIPAGLSFGQVPANDLCENAFPLLVTTTNNWVGGNVKGALPTSGIEISDSICFTWVSSVEDVWFSFSAPEKNLWIKFTSTVYSFNYQLFEGTCDSMSQLKCFPHFTNINNVDSTLFGPFIIGKTYFLRVCHNQNSNLPSYPFSICVTRSGITNYRRSKLTGGLWTSASTWVENRVPGEADSVEIVDGSFVTLPGGSATTKVKWLRIGGSDTVKRARLRLLNDLRVTDHIEVSKGDSIVGTANYANDNSVKLWAHRDIRLDGVIYKRGMALHFSGTEPQNFYGTGKFLHNYIQLYFENPTRVDFGFPARAYQRLWFEDGFVKFHQPIEFHMLASANSVFNTSVNQVLRHRGRYEGVINYTLAPGFVFAKATADFYYGLNRDDDTLTRPGPEFYNNSGIMRRIFLQRFNKNNVFHLDSSLSISVLTHDEGPIRMKHPTDTLFFHWSDIEPQDTLRAYMEVGKQCLWLNPKFETEPSSSTINGPSLTAYKNGKSRNLEIVGNWWQVPGQKICLEMHPSPPTGPVVAPLTSVGGASVVEIRSARPIPANTLQFYMTVNTSDNLVYNAGDLYVAQGPTVNGPWRAVSLSNPNSFYPIRKTELIDFSQGHFFCWATSGQVANMSVVEFLPPVEYYKGGCDNAVPQRVGVVVSNRAFVPSSGYSVFYQQEGGAVQGIPVSYPVGSGLAPLKRDTVWFDSLQGSAITQPGLVSYKSWVRMVGDTVFDNDTLYSRANYVPDPVPYLNRFDTVASGSPGAIQVPNIPYRWFNKERYEAILRISSGQQGVSTNYFWRVYNYSTNNKTLYLQPPPGRTTAVYTPAIGPLQGPSLFEFRYRIGNEEPPVLNQIPQGDTLFVEASGDCGSNWVVLRKIHRSNRSLGDTFALVRDSVPFSAGTSPVFRFRQMAPNSTSPIIARNIDQVRLYAGTLPVGIREAEQRGFSSLRVFPNPGSQWVYIQVPEGDASPTWVTVHSVSGRQVWSGSLEDHKLDVSMLPPGLYQIRVKTVEKVYSARLVIAR
jgi:hypothetical protein